MSISAFELLKIGIGPSSSHTVGPMKAANAFLKLLKQKNLLNPSRTRYLKTELYGSLALTGKGHGTDKAILLGLEGEDPKTIDISTIHARTKNMDANMTMKLNSEYDIPYNRKHHLLFHKKKILPHHTNGMKFTALDESQESLLAMNYYSIGGGFFLSEDEVVAQKD